MKRLSEEKPIRLHLELKDEFLSEDEQNMLKQYGKSPDGFSIIRDVLVPADYRLYDLHKLIQTVFGWDNVSSHVFTLTEAGFEGVIDNKAQTWADLVGVLFPAPRTAREIKQAEKGGGQEKDPKDYGKEDFDRAQARVEKLFKENSKVEVEESLYDLMVKYEQGKDVKSMPKETVPIGSLTAEEMISSAVFDPNYNNLLEHLRVDEVLATEDEELTPRDLRNLDHTLLYYYDPRADWEVTIKKTQDADDLIEDEKLSEETWEKAVQAVMEEGKPAILHKEGLSVLEGVGGFIGYADFLRRIHDPEDPKGKPLLKLAMERGWSPE
mgnify:CR=1 FL=1